MSKDFFGLAREAKIKKSGVRSVFTPHQPIRSFELFLGRENQVSRLLEHISTPGQHALLYGDRGVGKSSLANIASDLLISKLIDGKLYKKRCDSSDTFETIIDAPLKAAGFEVGLEEQTTSHTQSGDAGIAIPVIKAGIKSERGTTKTFRGSNLSPSLVAEHLADFKGLLLIDETDALGDSADKKRLAELIKLLSDNGSKFKLLVVGIAETADELTGAHPSVQRCLKETKLERMAPPELRLIINKGADQLGLTFGKEVVDRIVRLSSGYAHFTHLLALKCAEDAVTEERNEISLSHLESAMARAVEEAEGSLQRSYEAATRSHSTDMYRSILSAAANLDRVEFSAGQLRESIRTLTGTEIAQASLNNFLTRLVSANQSTILQRKAKGIYKFADPRMPSFIRIASNGN